MVGVWTYPWTLYEEGLETACEELASRGVDELVVSAHHHAIRVFQPRLPDAAFDGGDGGCYFDPSPGRFAETPIRPVHNEVDGVEDPLAEIAAVAADHGLATHAWTYFLHNPRLAGEHPDYRIEDALGNAHDHAFCPSHPEVRRYDAGVVADVAARDVDAVEVQGAKFPSVFHGQRLTAGIDARQVLASETEERLFSQCFCDGCRRAASEHAVEFERARTVVRDLVERSLGHSDWTPMPLADLVHEYPVLADLFRFRNAVVESLLGRLADAAGGVTLDAYVREVGPDWSTGTTLATLQRHVDRVTHTCYVSDPAEARDRVRTLVRSTDLPVDAGVTIDPAVIDGAADLHAVVDSIRAETDGRISVFNHAMMTDDHLDWVVDLAT